MKQVTWRKPWTQRIDDSAVVHKDIFPDTSTHVVRHGYIPMDDESVTDRVRDAHLAAYISGLKEYDIWVKRSVPASIVLILSEEKEKQKVEEIYRDRTLSEIQAIQTTKRIFTNGSGTK